MIWLPLVAWCADGDTFTANTVEGIAMTFKVTSEADKQCQVGTGDWSPAVNGSTKGPITIPSKVNGYSVTSIRNYAFNNCGGLTSVTIPNSVTSIGESAFRWCSGLTSITIPNNVTSIGERVFYGCSGLTSVTIPNSVTSIGQSAFGGCSGLTSIIVGSGNTVYDSRNNCNAIIKTSTNELIAGCKNTIIPNSVTSIGKSAFSSCYGLTSVTIPNSVTSIGNCAFEFCSGLTSVTIPNSVSSIGNNAFNECSGLTSVTIPNSVTSTGEGAFANCFGLTSVTIPISVTSIGNWAFSNCTGLTSVTIPNSVTSIGESAFEYCSGLTSVTIPNSVTSIGYSAFKDCSGLTSITIPNSVTSIGSFAFNGCSGLTEVTIPNSVTSIDYYAFSDCSGLTSVTIPNSVTSIGQGAFAGCSGLTSIIVESGNTVYDSRNNCNAIIETSTNELIAGCKNTTIPNSVTSIGGSAFSGCSGLTSVTIPNSVTSIGESAFHECSGLTSVTIPNSVTSIGYGAFYGCSGLTDVYSQIEEPFAIGPQVFRYKGNYSYVFTDATLHVPAGTKAKYEATDGWKEFKTIVESPVVTTDEVIAADDTETVVGKTTTVAINLTNKSTDLTAYQFDLTLPAGITLAVNDKGKYLVTKTDRYEDDSQSLTVQKVDGTTNTYRVMSFSLENGLITGTEGALLTVRLQADADLAEGEYIARMENIVMTRKDGTQMELSDATLKITVNRITMGDTNGDEIVNVTDIVEVVNCIMGHPSAGFVRAAADLNGDNIVNVTDIVMIVNIIMSDGKTRSMEPATVTDANDRLTLDGKGGDSFGLSLHNDARYVAAQMDIVLTEGQTLENVTLSKNRCGSHLLNCQQTGRNTYRVMVFSMANEGFEGFDGSLLDFSVTGGTGGFSVENIVFVKADETQRTFDALYGQTTGIGATLNDKEQMINDNWYDLNGRKLDSQPNRKGVFIRNGKKQVK